MNPTHPIGSSGTSPAKGKAVERDDAQLQGEGNCERARRDGNR